MRAVRLRTVDLKNPLGIDDAAPMLSWNCEGGKKQRAYQLRVTDAVSGELFFDSGRVESDKRIEKPDAGSLERDDLGRDGRSGNIGDRLL